MANATTPVIQINEGNVGIGTASPGAKLEVYGSSPNIRVTNTAETDAGIVFNDAQAGTGQMAAIKFNSSDEKLKFFVNDEVAQRMVIDTAGNVGIGTNTPTHKLEVAGDIRLQSDNQIYFGATGSIPYWTAGVDNTTNNNFVIGGASYYTGDRDILLTPAHNGNVGIGTTSPLAKLQVDNPGQGEFAGGDSSASGGSHLMLKDEGSTSRTLMSGPSVVFQTPANSDGTNLWATSRLLGSPAAAGSARGTFSIQVRDEYDPLNDGTSWNWRTALTAINTGSVGIGTTSPNQKLHVNGGTQLGDINATTNFGTVALKVVEGTVATGPTLGSGAVGAQAVLYSNGSFGMYTGVSNNGDTWMQSQRNDASTSTYDILLNPAGGNVGIGTISPGARLEVVSYGLGAYIYSSQSTGLRVRGGGNSADIAQFQNVGGSTVIAIDDAGKIGMNVTNPVATLDMISTTGGYSSIVQRMDIPSYGTGLVFDRSASGSYNYTAQSFRYNGSIVGQITVNTTSISISYTSDYRLKENREDISDAIERVKELKPVKFNWIKEPGKSKVDGFYAHELAEVVPEAVVGEKDALDWEGNPHYQSIDPTKIVPLLTAALQQAIDKIEELELRINKLEK